MQVTYFKLCMMITSMDVHTVLAISVTLAGFQGHKAVRKVSLQDLLLQ